MNRLLVRIDALTVLDRVCLDMAVDQSVPHRSLEASVGGVP